MYHVALQNFKGPFDLLLELVSERKLDITQISLAQVTDQFISYLETAQTKNSEELADFLMIATRLLVLKSRALFPDLEIADETGIPLEAQLRAYKAYRDAASAIERMIQKKQWVYFREKPVITPYFNPPLHLKGDDLEKIWKTILERIEKFINLPKIAVIKAVTLGQRIAEIQALILKKVQLTFRALIQNAKNKPEIIINFLALLELVKQRIITVKQSTLFEDISITQNHEPGITT